MSLDVFLVEPTPHSCNCPYCDRKGEKGTLFRRNVTHNLTDAASVVGLYMPLWNPDKMGVTKAAQLIEPLRAGLAKLEADPDAVRHLEPSNGWGTIDGLISFTRSYLCACEKYPDADVEVSR